MDVVFVISVPFNSRRYELVEWNQLLIESHLNVYRDCSLESEPWSPERVLSLPTHYLMCPADTVRHLSVVKAWAQSQPNGAGIQGQFASRWLRSSLSFYSATITPFVK